MTQQTEKLATENPLIHYQNRLKAALGSHLSVHPEIPATLNTALHYVLKKPGKGLRPALIYTVGECLQCSPKALDAAAVAVELIHTYSLIHDDLPAMDDDDIRRGQPSCHKAFDEATAILLGDGLQSLAFEILAAPNEALTPNAQLAMINYLGRAIGMAGMVAGQALDVGSAGKILSLAALEDLHSKKTGALMEACFVLPALAINAPIATQAKLKTIGKKLGLAFQIQDDILDVESQTANLGKPQGSDIRNERNTYPQLMGLDGAKRQRQQLKNEICQALLTVEMTESLHKLVNRIIRC